MLAILLLKQIIIHTTKVIEIEKKPTDHNHDKYITTPEFNKLAADVFNARLVRANLITKTDFDSKLSNLNRKITENKKNIYLKKKKTEFNRYVYDFSVEYDST